MSVPMEMTSYKSHGDSCSILKTDHSQSMHSYKGEIAHNRVIHHTRDLCSTVTDRSFTRMTNCLFVDEHNTRVDVFGDSECRKQLNACISPQKMSPFRRANCFNIFFILKVNAKLLQPSAKSCFRYFILRK